MSEEERRGFTSEATASLIDSSNPVLSEHVTATKNLSQALSLPDTFETMRKLSKHDDHPAIKEKIDNIAKSIKSKERLARLMSKRREK